MENNQQKFLRRIDHAEATTGKKVEVDLSSLKADFGINYNTLSIINTDTGDPIEIYLDGVKVKYVTANNGTFSFDWEFGLDFSFLSFENVGAGTIIANEIKISVGRTGG